ncbi:MAG: tRNA (N(6)-L-threonylcarbamoyladenosine(37)-C(2))-methylthiotransferase MtaB [Hyphomicrobiales bacterium]
MSKPELITFGCRLNSYESEIMRGHANAAGLEDAVIINTCAVTTEATRQARQSIRRARRSNRDAKIIVTGCAAQIDPAAFSEMPEVDLVLGNEEKLRAESYLPQSFGIESEEQVQVSDIMAVRETAPHMIDGFGERTRAFVQVQNGCDHRCTFCVIPYGRGNSRSVPAGAVVEQVRRLVENGYGEIVLTGVDITSYGPDLPGKPTFGGLVRRILKAAPDLQRLRLSSIDSVEADPELMRAIAEEERLMPHLHLSLQAGDDMVLKRMKRRHLREDAIAFCNKARELRPDMIFGADIIAGFPTETEEMFQNSVSLVEECGLTWLHVFPYSPRPGTPAARMPQVQGDKIKDRARRLREAGQERVTSWLHSRVGQKEEVLVETPDTGRTPHYSKVLLNKPCEPGSVVHATINAHDDANLYGRIAA